LIDDVAISERHHIQHEGTRHMTTAPIKAIETTYAGCRFRSRLEARWAVFFDHLRIRWQYEPQGYVIGPYPADATPSMSSLVVREGAYLPDFWLPESRLWVEVKGAEDALDIELLANATIPQWGLPDGPESKRADPTNPAHRILMLGPIPEPSEPHWTHSHAVMAYQPRGETGVILQSDAVFEDNGGVELSDLHPEDNRIIADTDGHIFYGDRTFKWGNLLGCGGVLYDDISRVPQRPRSAYAAARSARFEHGERGR
jgi:hypothetical protein